MGPESTYPLFNMVSTPKTKDSSGQSWWSLQEQFIELDAPELGPVPTSMTEAWPSGDFLRWNYHPVEQIPSGKLT